MKIIKQGIIFSLVLLGFVSTKEQLTSTNEKINIIGEAFNTDSNPVEAITYGVANNEKYKLIEDGGVNYIKPEMVAAIPEVMLGPKPGPLEAVDEIPSPTAYYDGGLKLNRIEVKCKTYANPTDCLHQSSCGWCGSNGSCISGNNVGPFEPCVKGSFIFSPPQPNWNPQARVVSENVGGVKLTVVSK